MDRDRGEQAARHHADRGGVEAGQQQAGMSGTPSTKMKMVQTAIDSVAPTMIATRARPLQHPAGGKIAGNVHDGARSP
jgi:hypothetical protein